MNIGEAVSTAMRNVLAEQDKTVVEIVKTTRVSETAMRHALKESSSKPSIKTIHEFCCGTGYTLEEFFARKEFDDLE